MGFFKNLFGGGAKESLSPWQEQLRKVEKPDQHKFWEWETPAARELVKNLLSQAAPAYGNATVKEVADGVEEIQLRGTHDGAPVRFCVAMWRGILRVELRCENRIGGLHLHRDHEKIPKEQDEADPWSDNEERRIFLAKGIFFEGFDRHIAEWLRNWSMLPPALQEQVLTEMERLDMMFVKLDDDSISARAPALRELEDPLEHMGACTRLLAQIKNAVVQGSRDPAAPHQGVSAPTPLTCKYCSSLFVLGPDRSRCPNCGAPAEG